MDFVTAVGNQVLVRRYCQWKLNDEVSVKINGEWRYPWRAVDHEGEGG